MSNEAFKPPVNTWKWRVLGPAANERKPMSPQLKASIQAPIMALVGLAMFYFFHHLVVPIIVWTLAGLVLVGGWLVPPIFHGFEKFGQWLAKGVMAGLNWLLLTPFFYLCFIPGRLILLVRRIDPMDRRFPDARESFWIPRKPVGTEQYKRQH